MLSQSNGRRNSVVLALLVFGAVSPAVTAGQDEKPKADAPKQEQPPAPQPRRFGGLPGQPRMQGQVGFSPFISHPRLGVTVGRPSETLVEQLDLPKSHALVVESVIPDSPAAKAGIKAHDILLKMQDKPVPGEPAEFNQMLAQIKADTSVDLVVLRKGKEQTVKDVKLPEVKAGLQPGFQRGRGASSFPTPPAFPNAPGFPGQRQPFPGGIRRVGVTTTLFRSDDHFTISHLEAPLNLSVTGKLENGKVSVSSIHVQDGIKNNTYESVDKVPEEYRAKVNSLVEMCKAGNIKVEVHTPDKDAAPKKSKER